MTDILIIGGTDSSGGAGLTRDTAAASALGVGVAPVVTAVTAQTHSEVAKIVPIPPDVVAAQIHAALHAGSVKAVKIGMLGSNEIAETVAAALKRTAVPVVLDPVLKSSSGARLLSGGLPEALICLADLITPNLLELAALTGHGVAQDERDIAFQSGELRAAGARAILVKGGHGGGEWSTDYLFACTGSEHFTAPRLAVNKRGTGCTLATAISCFLALGHDLSTACGRAKTFIHTWLETA